MKKDVKNSTFRIAYCGIISALSLALMMFTSLIPIGTYAFPCFAGIIIASIVIEYGYKWAMSVFLVAGILSVFLAGDKEAVIYFISFFGYYPILKGVIEGKIKNKLIQFFLKFFIFNIAAIASFFVANIILAIPAEEYTLFGVYVPFVFLIIGNIFFFFYDYAVTVFVNQYINKIRKKLFNKK